MQILDKNVNNGRKFYLVKNGIVKTFWLSLIITLVLEIARQVFLIFGIKAMDTALVWKFMTMFMIAFVGGLIGYTGFNVLQKHINRNGRNNNGRYNNNQ